MTEFKTEMALIGRLKPAEWNPREISDKRFAQLCESIKADADFMKLRPLLATKDGTIYAGNMRFRACLELGWKEVPAIFTDISESLAKQRAVKDNNQYGEWTEDYATMLMELVGQDIDMTSLGLNDEDMQMIGDIPKVEDELGGTGSKMNEGSWEAQGEGLVKFQIDDIRGSVDKEDAQVFKALLKEAEDAGHELVSEKFHYIIQKLNG